jgi:hypothetical protein
MVATFLYALLSKRAFLVDWPEVKPMPHWNNEEVVAMPHISKLFEKPSFNWDYSDFSGVVPEFRCDSKTEYKAGDETALMVIVTYCFSSLLVLQRSSRRCDMHQQK